MVPAGKTVYTLLQALEKARRWCALQERCHGETRSKVQSWGFSEEDADQLVAQLISEGFLSEERFARAFARGKFRIKQWGRTKIIVELKRRKISEFCIRKGLEEIDDDEYQTTLQRLFDKRVKEVKERNPWKRKAKILSFLLAKGYERDLILSLLDTLNHKS